MNKQIEVIVTWKIKENAASEILKFLPELAEKTKKEIGNTLYTIFQSEKDASQLILHECYRDEEALIAHKNSEHYQSIVTKKIIPNLELREVVMVKKIF